MNRRHFLSGSLLVLIIVLIWRYLDQRPDLLDAISRISAMEVLMLTGLRFLLLLQNGITLKLLTEAAGIRLHWREWGGLPLITTLFNYIAPFSAGILARAAYLKHRHGLSYSRFTGILGVTYLVLLCLAGGAGAVLAAFFSAHYYPAAWSLGAVYLLSCIGGCGAIFFRMSEIPFLRFLPKSVSSRINESYREAISQLELLRIMPKRKWQLVSNNIGILLLNGLCLQYAFHLLDTPVGFPAALFVSLSTLYATAFTITPGNFGIPEALSGMASALIGSSAAEAFLAMLLLRAGTITVVFLLGPLAVWNLKQNMDKI